jgi:hypothetical protein
MYINQGFTDSGAGFTFKGDSFIETTGLIFGKTSKYNLDSEKGRQQLSELLKYMRTYSLQYDLTYNPKTTLSDAERLTKSRLPLQNRDELVMYEYQYATFLKWTDFTKIDKARSRGKAVPIHKEIFLDAFSAYFESDYRKAILYFCIACEIKLSEKLFVRYEELKKKDRLKHIVHESADQDFVYELLRREKWQFKHKLHEHYVYLFDRSLLTENKSLYDSLLTLYKTRNKIAHEGKTNEDQLAINSSGSSQALNFAIEFFDWLGDESLNIFKNQKEVLMK